LKKIDLGQTITLLANLGVLVGVFLLIYELSQNRNMMRAQIRNEISRTVIDLAGAWADEEMVELIARSRRGDSLTDTQEGRLQFFSNSLLRMYENIHYQYREGMFAEDEYTAVSNTIRRRLNTDPHLRNHFCDTKDGLSPAFVEAIEGWLNEPC
jgi:hypothetical protein